MRLLLNLFILETFALFFYFFFIPVREMHSLLWMRSFHIKQVTKAQGFPFPSKIWFRVYCIPDKDLGRLAPAVRTQPPPKDTFTTRGAHRNWALRPAQTTVQNINDQHCRLSALEFSRHTPNGYCQNETVLQHTALALCTILLRNNAHLLGEFWGDWITMHWNRPRWEGEEP